MNCLGRLLAFKASPEAVENAIYPSVGKKTEFGLLSTYPTAASEKFSLHWTLQYSPVLSWYALGWLSCVWQTEIQPLGNSHKGAECWYGHSPWEHSAFGFFQSSYELSSQSFLSPDLIPASLLSRFLLFAVVPKLENTQNKYTLWGPVPIVSDL